MLIEGKLIHAPDELRHARSHLIIESNRKILNSLLAASSGPVESKGADTRTPRSRGRHQGKALIKRACDQSRLPEPRMADGNELLLVHKRLRFKVVHYPRHAPGPGADVAPVVAR